VKSTKQVVRSPYISFGSAEVSFQAKPSSKLLAFICLPQRLSEAASQLCPTRSSLVNDTLLIHLTIMGLAAIISLLWLTGTQSLQINPAQFCEAQVCCKTQ